MAAPITPRGATVEERMRLLTRQGENGCLEWVGSKGRGGYGQISINRRLRAAHRVAYEMWVGPIGDLTVDHLCFNPGCVNTEHMRLLTMVDNARNQLRAYKTECIRGHAYTPENTGWQPNRRNLEGAWHRYCRECKRALEASRRNQRGAA